jgi:hypothetical protein
MLPAYVTQRLQAIGVLPELQRALEHMAAYDDGRIVRNRQWGTVIPTVQRILAGSAEAITPFTIAWNLMYAALIRLDHLQDGDPVDNPPPTVDRPSAQYNLLFGYYILAEGLLDLLSPDHIPIHRILRLRRMWTDAMLRMASGQQRDLICGDDQRASATLDDYQQLVQAKTGATFALAFGGTAALLTDSMEIIDALTLVGELYGTLLQYGDDLHDVEQPNVTLTLPTMLHMVQPSHLSEATGHTRAAFWACVYDIYHQQVVETLKGLSDEIQQGILTLFAETFGQRQSG